jgi:hypothetical protein
MFECLLIIALLSLCSSVGNKFKRTSLRTASSRSTCTRVIICTDDVASVRSSYIVRPLASRSIPTRNALLSSSLSHLLLCHGMVDLFQHAYRRLLVPIRCSCEVLGKEKSNMQGKGGDR